MTTKVTPALTRADEALRELSEDGARCVHAGVLAKRLWPDSPGWHRTSNVGYGATTGVGPKRAAGGILKRLIEAGAARHCGPADHSLNWQCYGYRSTGTPLADRKQS